MLEIKIKRKTLQISTASTTPFSEDIVAQFPNLTTPAQGTFQIFKHVIAFRNNAKPHVTKPRTLPFARRKVVSTECQQMVDDSNWSPIDKSSWLHAIVAVPKPDGSVRITTDLSPLHKYVVPERHQLPHIQELFLKLRGVKYFT